MPKLPFRPVQRPARRVALGYLATAAAPIPVGASLSFAALLEPKVPSGLSLAMVLVLLVVSLLAARSLARLGRKLRQPDPLEILADDSVSPVLLLRSFDHDDVVDLTSRTGRTGLASMEESLCLALRDLGPVIAIGRPGERLPGLGAARLYVDDQTWQSAVQFLMLRAGAIVIVVGESKGIRWELETGLARASRKRLLLCFPYMEAKATRRSPWHFLTPRVRMLGRRSYEAMEEERRLRYHAFRERFDTRFGFTLPASLEAGQFLDFLDELEPRILETVRPSRFDSLVQLSLTNAKVGIHMERTLKPFLTKLAPGTSVSRPRAIRRGQSPRGQS